MPALPRVPYQPIFDTLKKLPIFDENRVLKKERNPVWLDACQLLRDIKRHNLYCYVEKNRKNIKKNLLKHHFENPELTQPVNDTVLENTVQKNDSDTAPDDYINLHEMKFDVEFNSLIQKICPRSFHLMYWSPEQINLWKDLIHLDFPVSLILVDQLVQNVTMKNYQSSNIFLLLLAIKVEGTTITLAQAITEKKDREFIVRFCCEYLKNNIPSPSELSTAYDSALLDGVSRAFNNCSFNEYNLQCYEFLTKHVSALPSTRIKVDTFNLIKTIDGLECFNDKQQSVKKLYLLSIIYLSTVDTLQVFEDVVQSILILILSPFENDVTESKRLLLFSKVQTKDIQEKYRCYIEQATSTHGHMIFPSSTVSKDSPLDKTAVKLLEYVAQLELQARTICESTQYPRRVVNAYYCPDWFENYLKDLLSEFLAWTNITKQRHHSFDLATSSGVQHVTTLTEINQPMIASQFLNSHSKVLKLLCQKGRAFVNNNKGKLQSGPKPKYNHDCLNDQEDWMGKNEYYNEDRFDGDTVHCDEEIPGPLLEPQNSPRPANEICCKEFGEDNEFVQTANNTINDEIDQFELSLKNQRVDDISLKNPDRSVSSRACDDISSTECTVETCFLKKEDDAVLLTQTGKNIQPRKVLAHSTPLKIEESERSIAGEDATDSEQKVTDDCINDISTIGPDKTFSTNYVDYNTNTQTSGKDSDELKDFLEERNEKSQLEKLQSPPVLEHSIHTLTRESGTEKKLIQDITTQHSYCISQKVAGNGSIEVDKSLLSNIVDDDMNIYINSSESLPDVGFIEHRTELGQLSTSDESIKSNRVPADSRGIQSRELSVREMNCISIEHNYSMQPKIEDVKFPLQNKVPENMSKKKYVTPFPALKIYHGQAASKKRLKETLIRNGNCLQPRHIHSKKYVLEDTCKFDSIAEEIAFAYKNIKDFQTYCDNRVNLSLGSDPDFLKAIVNYCKSGNVISLYKSRALLLFNYGNRIGDVISCPGKVGSFFSKMMARHFSFKEEVYCSLCDKKHHTYQILIELSVISSFKIQNLGMELQVYFEEKQTICSQCKNVAITAVNFGPYLTIDIEKGNISDFVNVIPDRIKLKNNTFILNGIIGRQSSDDQLYIAFCRTIRGSWSKRSDIQKRIQGLRKLPKVTIALIMYVKVSTDS